MNEPVLARGTPCRDPYLPRPVVVTERREEGPGVVTLRLRPADPRDASCSFAPGQFNMLHGNEGCVPISIVAGGAVGYYEHCIRAAGNVTRDLVAARVGDHLGLRGPFGRGWPMAEARGKDVVIVSGGIGCAAVASAIDFIMADRTRYGRLSLLQGVRTDADHLYDDRYSRWAYAPDTRVLLSSMTSEAGWQGHRGLVTELLDWLDLPRPDTTVAMLCGPEAMVRPAVGRLRQLGIGPDQIFVSLERTMQCGLGHCGHCQLGSCLICRDGPVFTFSRIDLELAAGL